MVRLNWFIVKDSDLTRVPRLNAVMKMRLRRCLCICMALLLVSCASAPPKETYLMSNSLSNIKKVAILASANAPDVTPASQGGTAAAGLGLMVVVLAPLLILPYVAIMAAAESPDTDSASAKEI